MQSETTLFRMQQHQEEEAARLGLSGLAMTSRHDFIEARATRGAEQILHLLTQGKYAEAHAQMNLPGWGQGEEEEQQMSHFDDKRTR